MNTFTLSYNKELACIHMKIQGYITSHEFRVKTEELLDLIITHQVVKVLADTSQMQIIGADDQRWFLEDWLPRAIKAGYEACAMINSTFFFNRIAISTIADKIDKRFFTLQLFDNESQAKQWLCTYQPKACKAPRSTLDVSRVQSLKYESVHALSKIQG